MTFGILHDDDPKAERYCFRHGVYMRNDPVLLKKDGGMYTLSPQHALYYCEHCHREIKESEGANDVDLGEFTKAILQKAMKNHFEIWDSGEFDADMYQYIGEGDMSEMGEGTLITFGPDKDGLEDGFEDVEDGDVDRLLSEPSPNTKQMEVLKTLSGFDEPVTANDLSAKSEIGQCSSQLSTLWMNKMVERKQVGQNGLEYAYWPSKYAKMLLE